MNPLTPAVQNPNPLPLSSAGCSGADEKRTEEYLIILTNLRNASAVWGDSSRQYRACARAAAEYLGVGVEVEGGLVVGMEGLRL